MYHIFCIGLPRYVGYTNQPDLAETIHVSQADRKVSGNLPACEGGMRSCYCAVSAGLEEPSRKRSLERTPPLPQQLPLVVLVMSVAAEIEWSRALCGIPWPMAHLLNSHIFAHSG